MTKKQVKENKKEKHELGITAERDDFSDWFTQLMIKAELSYYSVVSGCMVLSPNSYAIWERIVGETDKRLKKLGVQNAYFPLFIPEKFLNKEKEHVQGFSPEVAWVTEAGETKLAERLAIRPTSETIMYPSYSKWIRSWRDLPLRINQWNNVVRWEFKHPVPFFRTREFLWNELHTVLASEKEALEEGKKILEIYNEICKDYLALYGVIGKKTEREKFAGGIESWKIHFIIPNGKILEGPCFHYDGQNFAKAYDIQFLNKEGKKQYAYQCTYAISTRMLGVMFAMHADSKGLIIPPKIAPIQVVIIPILFDDTKERIIKEAKKIAKELEAKNISLYLDDREQHKAGFKFNEYELKGIPIRIEIGPKDIESGSVMVYRRDTEEKKKVKMNEIAKEVEKILEDIQKNLIERSKKLFESKIEEANNLEKIKKIIENKRVSLSPLCKNEKCEEMLKFETKGAKAVFIDEKNSAKLNDKCVICGKKADYKVYVGKVY
ncbi:MAG: proline--tRNA ligase [Candidatus Pacearchaeota archaeon]